MPRSRVTQIGDPLPRFAKRMVAGGGGGEEGSDEAAWEESCARARSRISISWRDRRPWGDWMRLGVAERGLLVRLPFAAVRRRQEDKGATVFVERTTRRPQGDKSHLDSPNRGACERAAGFGGRNGDQGICWEPERFSWRNISRNIHARGARTLRFLLRTDCQIAMGDECV